MRIRQIEKSQSDAEAVGWFLLNTFATEFMFGSMHTGPVNIERAWPHVWQVVDEGAVWVTEDDHGITGSIAIVPKRLWWTDFDYFSDGWLYVDPNKRGSRAAIMLIDAAVDHAEDNGMPLRIDVTHNEDLEMKDRFFFRKGFARVGGYYMKETV